MLRLRLNTTYLTLAPDTSASINLINPIFDRDGAERLYSLPFKLLNSPENLAILRHANRLDRRGGSASYSGAVLEIEHQVFATGLLNLDGQSYSSKYISVTFTNEVPDLIEELDRIQIDEILETINIAQSISAWTFGLTISPPHIYFITLNAVAYVYNAPGTDDALDVLTALRNLINADHPGLASINGVPQLQLDSELMNDITLGALDGLELISVKTVGEASQESLKTHVNGVNTTPVSTHCFPTIHWEGAYAGNVRQFQGRLNVWSDGTSLDNEASTDPEAGWIHSYIPFVFLAYVFNRIKANTDFVDTWDGEFLDADVQDLIIFNNRIIDQVYYDRYANNVFKYLNGFQQSINLNEHVPEMTAGELFQRFISIFGYWFKYQSGRVTFYKKIDQLNKPPEDWTGTCEPFYSATRKKRRGFTLEYDKTNDLTISATQLLRYTSGNAQEFYTLPFHSIRITNLIMAIGFPVALLPTTRQTASSEEGGTGDNDYEFRLFFFRGLQNNADDEQYPLATHGNLNYDEDAVGNLSLQLSDNAGLYNRHHKGMLQLLTDGEPVTVAARLDVGELLSIRKWENTRRVINLPEGQMTGIIKSVQFKASTTGISIAKVELIKEP